MTFMINSLKKYIPFVIKAIPEMTIEGKWLSEHLDNCITSLNSVVSLNQYFNVNMYGNEQKGENIINHPSNTANHVYFLLLLLLLLLLFYFDPVHLFFF